MPLAFEKNLLRIFKPFPCKTENKNATHFPNGLSPSPSRRGTELVVHWLCGFKKKMMLSAHIGAHCYFGEVAIGIPTFLFAPQKMAILGLIGCECLTNLLAAERMHVAKSF
jgi:hypothetical protein